MKLSRYHLLIICLLLCYSSISTAQSLDEIIKKHIDAHGGEKNWEAIESMKIKAMFTAFSEEKEFMSIKTKAGEYYSELHLDKHPIKEAFDGEKGWTIDPWQEILFPRQLNKTEVNVFYQKADFFTPFYRYKENGLEVELLEEQNIDGMDMFVLKVKRPNNNWETWYLNKESYLEYKSESYWTDFAMPSPAESYFDDFRTVNGVVLPFFIERTFFQRDRILLIEEIEFNPKLEDGLFETPRSAEMQKLEFMEGEWIVNVEAWNRRRKSWMPADSTNSSISFESTNLLVEKIEYDMMFVQEKTINFIFDEAEGKYDAYIYNGFSSTMELLEGTVSDTAIVFETPAKYIDESGSPISQMKIEQKDDNNFVLTISASYDKGAIWHAGEKLRYLRR